MKAVAIILLVIIASGVGYLAYSEYQKRQIAIDIAEHLRDPEGYVAKEWAERARLKCDMFMDIELVDTQGGFKRPVEFTCVGFSTGNWTIVDRACTDQENSYSPGEYDSNGEVSKGYPEALGQLYKPSYSICWEVQYDRPRRLQELQQAVAERGYAIGDEETELRDEVIYLRDDEVPFTGLVKIIYDDGTVESTANYENGLQHGLKEAFYQDGVIRWRGEYAAGTGIWSEMYDESGKLTYSTRQ